MNTSSLRPLPILLALVTLPGCSLQPADQRPEVPLPAAYSAAAAVATTPLSADWWRAFGSPELDALMAQAMAQNLDLRAAVARIDQARAALSLSSAALLPSASASLSASHDRAESDSGGWASSDSNQISVSAGYQLDLWGGNRAARDAALARLDASHWDRVGVALTLQSSVASTYFQTLALREQRAIAQDNLTAAQQLLDLVQLRYDAGAATALDLAQQRTTLLNISATLPSLTQQLAASERALAVLLGQGRLPTLGERAIATLAVPDPATGLPAALLEQRPDIRIAEANLTAANADIGAARAALLPSLDLSLSAGVSGALSGGATTVTSMGASLVQVLFNGGALRAQVSAAQASREELTASYLQAVLTGVQEVEDRLDTQRSATERAAILTETAEQAREAYRLALIRFEAGSEDLLALLDAQRSRLSAEDSLIQARLERLTATSALFTALGGGWPTVQAAG